MPPCGKKYVLVYPENLWVNRVHIWKLVMFFFIFFIFFKQEVHKVKVKFNK